jgi:3-isopropylmalate/(R)-2-methylmalate dehydratase small subunit
MTSDPRTPRPFTVVVSRVVPFDAENVDTDQIIPARFLKTTDSAGLGDHLFEDLRRLPDGSPDPEFPLNRPENRGAQILLAGPNFGCGSSREHAAWALKDAGFRVVISTSFADIFRSNAMKNGLLPAQIPAASWLELRERCESSEPVTVDLAPGEIRWGVGAARFHVNAFAKQCLLEGLDELSYILKHQEQIRAFEARHEEGRA